MEVSVVPGCENGERGIESECIGNSLCNVIDGDSGTEGVGLICVNEEKNNHQEIVDDGAGPCSSNNNLIVSEKTTGCVAPSSAVLESTDESIEAPSVGMVFESWEDVESYYKGYGQQQGFGVSRVASAFRQGKDSMKIRRAFTWRCECYGRPDLRAIREAKKRAKGMEVGGCKAKLGKEYVKESFAKPVKSRLFNDCNSGFQVSQIHGNDEEEDIKSTKYVRNLVTGFKAEKVFQKAYTDKKFQEVQKEFERLTYCYSRGEKFVGEKVEHLMEDRVWVVPNGCTEEVLTDRRRCYRVTYNSKTREVECDCKMFETHGILCRHCIRVLDQHLFGEVPDKYILLRWRKDIPRKHSKVKVAYHDPLKTVEIKRYEKMMVSCEDICDNACVAEETMSIVIEGLKSIKVSVDDWFRSRQLRNGDVGGIETSTEDNTCQLHDSEEALH
ncbi:hypothetical protein BVRB_8g196450 [Beta vulgaris subsp. vulgaris]|nr:hypothetical protein BVRB_8g196450 [Beta vulgaris subsp. vulgaris]